MSLVSNWFLGKLGRLRATPLAGPKRERFPLPAPNRTGGMPLMQTLALRHSEREYSQAALTAQQLSDLLWAADGINRPALHEHTAPSAMNEQELIIYVALADGLFFYDAEAHALELVAHVDARAVTGLQDYVASAPVDLVYVADQQRMQLIPESRRLHYAAVCAGAIGQNVYLYCASCGLGSVVRGLFDERALRAVLGLSNNHQIILTQTVGRPSASSS